MSTARSLNESGPPVAPRASGSAPDVEPRSQTTDGRSLRRERNRDAVIVALLELIREGNYEPGTGEIAERAGVSHRSVFRYFDDLGDLVRAAIDHEIGEVVTLAVLPDIGQGPLEERIDTAIESVLKIYGYTSPVARVARARSLAIPTIDEGLIAIAHLYRDQLERHFAPELGDLEQWQAADLIDVIQVVISFESFDLAQRRLGRSDDEIRRAWRSALLALLAR